MWLGRSVEAAGRLPISIKTRQAPPPVNNRITDRPPPTRTRARDVSIYARGVRAGITLINASKRLKICDRNTRAVFLVIIIIIIIDVRFFFFVFFTRPGRLAMFYVVIRDEFASKRGSKQNARVQLVRVVFRADASRRADRLRGRILDRCCFVVVAH